MARDPDDVAADAEHELDTAEASEPADDAAEPDFDPTGTAALESDLTNLKDAAEELEED
ncbi:MAG TPA: hypothetical protein VFI00_03710 [Kribbella sp.]|nr:hypothetical protein [Kribbella sp.]